MLEDGSHGYEAIAEEFIRVRSRTNGLATIRKWAARLPRGGSVLDVGAGFGEPLTAALIQAGLATFAIDASPTMVAAFRQRFPDVVVACEAATDSDFFNRTFDGILAVGLVFLLPAEQQHTLIHRLANVLHPGGRLLFSAPLERGVWNDQLTGQPSTSLGADAYVRIIGNSGLQLVDEHIDEGGSHYYETRKDPDNAPGRRVCTSKR